MTTLDQLQARFARALLKKKKLHLITLLLHVNLSKCSLESLAYRRQIISLTTFHRYVFHHRDQVTLLISISRLRIVSDDQINLTPVPSDLGSES